MTRTSFGTVSHAERLPGAPNPVPTTPPSQLYERALTMVAMGFHGEATKVLRDITGHAPGHAPAWEKLAELLRLAEKDKEASDAMSRAANGSAVWRHLRTVVHPQKLLPRNTRCWSAWGRWKRRLSA